MRTRLFETACSMMMMASTLACGGGGPTQPSASHPSTVSAFLRDGATGLPVAGARVVVEAGQPTVTDASGVFEVPRSALGTSDGARPTGLAAAVDVDAAGYLPRRTRLATPTITLWPAASDAEREAIQAIAFDDAGFVRYAPAVVVHVSNADAGAERVWTEEMNRLTRETSISFSTGDYYAAPDGSMGLTVWIDDARSCTDPRGFCNQGQYFNIATVSLTSAAARDPVIVRRALLSMLLGTNPMDGLMNASGPQPALSPLESNALTMIRQRGEGLRWPDTDANR